ncbi:MAG: MerR family transcriptional regulator [Bradyrhizobiaceae bacterium]|nr:MAG: MerR family transcriptional regulator [Bradyrhizobiaceae bacterium]
MDKAPDAFRTISEVADELDIPAHVLRFWETRFVQIKPMKRSGGRRYYRPDDVHLLRGIRRLLYGEGYTIRGVQRILREHGIKAVQGILDEDPIAPAAFNGPSFDSDTGRHADTGLDESDDETFDTDDFEDEEDDPPSLSARGAMDFAPSDHRLADPVTVRPVTPSSAVPRSPSRPIAEIPVAAMPVAPKPVMPKPVMPSPPPDLSGAEAYAPPNLRKGARLTDKGKLQAVLDDLMSARELIDRVLKD